MPFESEAQRRWMYATKPQMAAEWQAHTPPGTKLPKKKKKTGIKIMKKADSNDKVRGLLYAAGLIVAPEYKEASLRTVNLETVSVEAAIDRLAMRKVAVDNGIEQPLDPSILNSSDFLSSIAAQVKQAESSLDPLARNALIGAGVGTVAGLGASAFSKRKHKNWVNNALLGGLAGGAIGGGYHMITNPDAMGASLATNVAGKPPDTVSPPIDEGSFMSLNDQATSRKPEIIGGTALAGGAAAGARYGLKKHLDLDKATGQLQGVLADPKKREMAEEFLQRTHGAPLPRTRDTKGLVDDLVTNYDPGKADDPVNSLLSKREFRKINPVSGAGINANKLRYRAGKLISDPATSGRFTGSNYARYDKLDDGFDVGRTLSRAHATDSAKLRASLAPVLGATEKELPQISRLGKAVRVLGKINPKKLAAMVASLGLATAGAYGMSSYSRSNAQQEQLKVLQELQKQRASK